MAIAQRTLLFEKGENFVNEMNRSLTRNADPKFISNYDKFVATPTGAHSLKECVNILREKMNLSTDADADIADCVYAYAAVHNPYKKFKFSLKV